MTARKKRNTAGMVALCGVLGALAIVIMMGGEFIPAVTFSCPILVMLLTVPVMEECGKKMAWVWFAAVSLLSFLLTAANPEAVMIYIFVGYYPLIRVQVSRIRPTVLRVGLKLLWYNGSLALAYGIMLYLMELEQLLQEMSDTTVWILVATILLANLLFFFVERVLKGFEVYYIVSLRKKLHFK